MLAYYFHKFVNCFQKYRLEYRVEDTVRIVNYDDIGEHIKEWKREGVTSLTVES